MRGRRTVLTIGALVVVIAIAALALPGVASAPLRREGARVCVGCIETHWNARSSIRANRLTGGYVFWEAVRYRVSFIDGEVLVAGTPLVPGCHEGVARVGETLELNDARGVRIVAPAEPGSCP